MDEYTGTQQQQQQQEMDIPNISTHELIPVQEDEDINFITELFNENNTLPKCELDQWLEDYLKEMELHNQQQEGEQSQEQSLWICVNTLIYHQLKKKILFHQVTAKKIMMKTMLMNKIIMEIIYTILLIVYFVVEVLSMEENKEKEEEILIWNL